MVGAYLPTYTAVDPHRSQRPFFVLESTIAIAYYIITFNQKDFVGIEQFGLQAIGPKQFLEEIGAIP